MVTRTVSSSRKLVGSSLSVFLSARGRGQLPRGIRSVPASSAGPTGLAGLLACRGEAGECCCATATRGDAPDEVRIMANLRWKPWPPFGATPRTTDRGPHRLLRRPVGKDGRCWSLRRSATPLDSVGPKRTCPPGDVERLPHGGPTTRKPGSSLRSPIRYPVMGEHASANHFSASAHPIFTLGERSGGRRRGPPPSAAARALHPRRRLLGTQTRAHRHKAWEHHLGGAAPVQPRLYFNFLPRVAVAWQGRVRRPSNNRLRQ